MKTKNQIFLEEFNKAFANNDTEFILSSVTNDISWTAVSEFTVEGKNKFRETIENMAGDEPYDLSIKNIITHGKHAAVDGIMTSKNGKQYAFCDIYKLNGFKDPKIREITSYVIEI